jgi:2,4-dienoyl-CoA reductase (NADPH2)
LKKKGVKTIDQVQYQKVDDAGLHISVQGREEVLPVDQVIICAGQLPDRSLYETLKNRGADPETLHLIGGADEAKELDAKRAIDQGARLAAAL